MYIRTESAKFKCTSQRLADQARLILKKSWLSDLKILEICEQVNCEEYSQEISLEELNYKISKTKSPLNPEVHQY